MIDASIYLNGEFYHNVEGLKVLPNVGDTVNFTNKYGGYYKVTGITHYIGNNSQSVDIIIEEIPL